MSFIENMKIGLTLATKQFDAGAVAVTGGLNKIDYAATKALQGIRDSANTFHLGAVAAEAYRLKMNGVADSIIKETAAARHNLVTLEQQKKAKEALTRAADQLQKEFEQEADSLKKLTATPIEQYVSKLRRLEEINKRGLFDPTTYARAQQRVRDELKRTEDAAKKAAKTTSDAARQPLRDFANLTVAIYGVQAAFRTVVRVLSTPLKLAANFEQIQISISTLLGSTQKATALIAQLNEYAAKTPWEIADIQNSARQMLAYGYSVNEIIPILSRMSDVAAGLSMPLGDLVYLMGTLKVQGRAFSKDINQFLTRGFDILPELAKQLGVAKEAVMGLVEEGAVSYGMVEKALVSLTNAGGRFYNLTKNQSASLAGLWSNLKDSATLTFAEIGKEMASAWDLKEVIAETTDFVNLVREQMMPTIRTTMKHLHTAAVFIYEFGKNIAWVMPYIVAYVAIQKSITLALKAQAAAQAIALALTGPKGWAILAAAAGIGAAAVWGINTAINSFTDELDKATQAAKDTAAETKNLAKDATKSTVQIRDMTVATQDLNKQFEDLQNRAKAVWQDIATPMDKYLEKWRELNDLYQQGAISAEMFAAANAKAFKEAVGYENNPVEQYEEQIGKLTAQLQSGLIDYNTFDFKRDSAKESIFGVTTDDIKSYKQRAEELRQLWVKGFITDDQMKNSAFAALPDIVKQAIEDTKTPMEKFKEQLKRLDEYKKAGLLNDAQYQTAKTTLEKDVFGNDKTPKFAGLANRNSNDAYQSELRHFYGQTNHKDKTPEKQLKVQEKTLKVLEKMEQKQGSSPTDPFGFLN